MELWAEFLHSVVTPSLWLSNFQVSLHFPVVVVAPISVSVSSGQKDCWSSITFEPSPTMPNMIFSQVSSHDKWEGHFALVHNLVPSDRLSPHLLSFLEFVIVICGRIKP